MDRGVKLQNSDKSIYIIDENNVFHSEEEYLEYEKNQKAIIKKNRKILFAGIFIIIAWFYYEVSNLNKMYSNATYENQLNKKGENK